MIRIFTLASGEKIIGIERRVQAQDAGVTYINEPYYITESQDEYGNNGLRLINVCTFSDDQYILVDDKHIVFSISASNNMIRYYEKLVLANKNNDITKMIDNAIDEMEKMENNMRDVITKRLVGKSTIN